MTLSVQLMTMIAMVTGGFYLGAAQDTHRRLSVHWEHRPFVRYVMEVSFWLMQTLILFYVLFLVNNGELGMYVFLAGLLGYSTYRALAAPTYTKILEKLITMVKNILHAVFKVIQILIIIPVMWVVRMVMITIMFILNLFLSILLFLLKMIYWPVKWLFSLIYRIMPDTIQRFLHKVGAFYSTIENTLIKWTKHHINKWRS